MAVVFLGIGSNLGDREAFLNEALKRLEEAGIQIIQASTVIETEPVGGPSQGKYLNAVLKVETLLSPVELLKALSVIESDLGRVRSVPNAPRTMDLDILLYDNIILNTTELVIPHPRMKQRAFVMEPLREIAPEIAQQIENENHPFH